MHLPLRPPSPSSLPSRWGCALSPHGRELLKAKSCGLLNEIPVVAASTLLCILDSTAKNLSAPSFPAPHGFVVSFWFPYKFQITPIRALGLLNRRLKFLSPKARLRPTGGCGSGAYPQPLPPSGSLNAFLPSLQTAENKPQPGNGTHSYLSWYILFWGTL